MSECATALEGWKKLQPTMSNKSAKQQVEAIERLVDEEHEKARGCLDDLLTKTPDMKRTFLAQLPEKLVGENFVLTEGDVRTLTAFGISPEDQRKLISDAAKAHASKSLSAVVETEWKTKEGAKKYEGLSNMLGGYLASAREVYADAESALGRARTAVNKLAEEIGSVSKVIADNRKLLDQAQKTLEDLQSELAAEQKIANQIGPSIIEKPNDSDLSNLLAQTHTKIADLTESIGKQKRVIAALNATIVGSNKEQTRLTSELGKQDVNRNKEEQNRDATKDYAVAAEAKHQVSVEDMRAAVKLSKDMRRYRIDRVQSLYTDLIGTLPPGVESVDYSQGNGYVLQRMYTILIESGGNKAHKGEVEVATRELQVLFGIETTGKIGPKLLDALESHVRKQKEQKLQELKRVEPKAVA